MGVPFDCGPIQGDIIKWAREQRGLTMRQVQDADEEAPSCAYQSEVEQGKKTDIHGDKLKVWLRILDMPEALVRGAHPRYHADPALARGLAPKLTDEVLMLAATPHWATLQAADRLRTVLRLLVDHLTDLVVAYVLGLDLEDLKGMIAGTIPIPEAQVRAIADLILLDRNDILHEGVSNRMITNAFGPDIRDALARGNSMETIRRLLNDLP